jgi:hypothetical protein
MIAAHNIYFYGKSLDKEKSTKTPGDDELEQVVGTTEDEFGETVAQIREKELLFGSDSLLTVFGPLIVNICANNKTYNVSPSFLFYLYIFFLLIFYYIVSIAIYKLLQRLL